MLKLIYPEHLCQGLAVEESKGFVFTTSRLKQIILNTKTMLFLPALFIICTRLYVTVYTRRHL